MSRRICLWMLVAPLVFALACGMQQGAKESAGETLTVEDDVVAESPAVELSYLPNGRMLDEGVLLGGQPTEEQFAQLWAAGYRTAINLRTPGEPGTSGEEIEALGMRYRAIPIASAASLTEENARALSAELDRADGPVVIYCGSGNRVGALLALKAYHVDGLSAEEALALGKRAGVTRLEPKLREILGLSAG